MVRMYGYINTGSLIHRLHPVVKVLWLFSISLVVLFTEDLIFMSGLIVFLILIAFFTHLPFKVFVHYMFFLLGFFVLIVVALFIAGIPLSQGYLFLARFIILLLSAVLFVLTTSNKELMFVLVRLKVPMTFSYSLTIALRFLPLLIDEVKMVSDAQKIRGHRIICSLFRPVKSIRSFIPIIVPVFIIVFKRSLELSVSSDSRGFTPLVYARKRVVFTYRDFFAFALMLLMVSCVFVA